jgi:hypothetical protein
MFHTEFADTRRIGAAGALRLGVPEDIDGVSFKLLPLAADATAAVTGP